MKLIEFDNVYHYGMFEQFLTKYRKGRSLDKNLKAEYWAFFREGFKEGRNEVLEIFDKLNAGLQTEKL